jgi:hypothetical protein
MSDYSQISTAADWYFVQLADENSQGIVVYPVAVWALGVDGNVIGLISVPNGGPSPTSTPRVCRLIPPPPVRGLYKHESELNDLERTALITGKAVKVEG